MTGKSAESPVTVVVFDIGGTLIDSTAAHHASLTLGIPFIQTGLHVFDAAAHPVFETLLPVTPELLRSLSKAPDPTLFSLEGSSS